MNMSGEFPRHIFLYFYGRNERVTLFRKVGVFMAYSPKNIKNPAAEYLFKLQLIVSNSEFKNKDLASKYEDLDTKTAGEAYVRAKLKTDLFESYDYDDRHLYFVLSKYGIPEDRIFMMIANHNMIPPKIKRVLLAEARQQYIDSYVEKNKYYCNLAGMPFTGYKEIPADRIFTIPDEFFAIYVGDGQLEAGMAIHQMPPKYQELFMNSPYYEELLAKFPDVEYIKYIGSNAIPIEVSRRVPDGEIMRINTSKLSTYHKTFGNVTVSADIVHLFSNVYKKTRDYVYNTLRGDFASIYPNYNNFIRFLTIYMAIGQSLNELMKKSSSMSYMNNATANNFFVLYGLPSVIMEGQSMISFLKKFRMLLMDKGTNVVYRVKDYVGYKYTDIYTLVMVKQQVFKDGMPLFSYDTEGKATPVQNIVFRRLGTTDDNTSYFKFRDSHESYPWEEIASGDPRWWNTPEVEQMLYDMNYTLSNSKYIQLSTHMSMSDIYWQTVILLRGLLDKKKETQYSKLSINYDIGGESEMTVFDAVLVLIILMNWNTTLCTGNTMRGDLFYNNGTYNDVAACLDLLFDGLMADGKTPNPLKLGRPFKVSSFNFDIRLNDADFYNSLRTFDYLEPDTFLDILDKALDNQTKSTGELMMTDVRNVYDYLERKLLETKTIHEFRQVTDAFNHLFLVDPVRDGWLDDIAKNTTQALLDMYSITEFDLASLASFCQERNIFVEFNYNGTEYKIRLGKIMNENASNYEVDGVYVFRDSGFVNKFTEAMKDYTSSEIDVSNLPSSIKLQYQNIISDKVLLDIGATMNGPKTFESLLYQHNTKLYRRLVYMKSDGSNLIMLMRAIIKALENYSASDLSALEFSALGETEYINILKEIIGYFKSYMVEYTKEEFVYVMDGLFDNGGNSNMLRIYDEIPYLELDMMVEDSITLHDVSNSDLHQGIVDDEVAAMYDEAVIRAQGTYAYIKQLGYDIWFDDGNRITKNKPDTLTDDSILTVNLIPSENTYKIIIPIENIE